MRNGRPLRFLVLTLGGWTGMRTVALWQAAVAPGTSLPLPLVGIALADPASPVIPGSAPVLRHSDRVTVARPFVTLPPATVRHEPPVRLRNVALALAALVRFGPAQTPPQDGAIAPPLRPTPIAPHPSRLAGSAWLIARGGGMASGGGTPLTGGQLGASQAGARLTYALGTARRIALSARIATPLHGKGREAAVGIDWQPMRAPLHLIAEQRVSLDGGHGGPTVMAVGGIGPTPVAAGFRLEAYGEAGAIVRPPARGGVEGFGDGAARLTRPVIAIGPATIDMGAGSWGAIQRGARRLDIGPTLGAVLPFGRGAHYRAVRLTLDWRQRVAGDARPGSGPALSIGTDF